MLYFLGNLLCQGSSMVEHHIHNVAAMGSSPIPGTIMWFVYILLCADGSLYTGSTNHPDTRFVEHKSGKGGRYTRSHKPLKRIYIEELTSKSEALKREIEIKSWPRAKKITDLSLDVTRS